MRIRRARVAWRVAPPRRAPGPTCPSGVRSSPVYAAPALASSRPTASRPMRCNAQPSCPHHRRSYTLRGQQHAAPAARAGSAVARGCGRGRAPLAPIAQAQILRCVIASLGRHFWNAHEHFADDCLDSLLVSRQLLSMWAPNDLARRFHASHSRGETRGRALSAAGTAGITGHAGSVAAPALLRQPACPTCVAHSAADGLGRLCARARSGSFENGTAPVSGAGCARTRVGCGAPSRFPPRGIWWPRSG